MASWVTWVTIGGVIIVVWLLVFPRLHGDARDDVPDDGA